MNKYAVCFFAFASICHPVFSAAVNSEITMVSRIKADYYKDSENQTKYLYQFSPIVPTCRSPLWAFSADENVNKVLQIAYVTGTKIKVGLASNCQLTTVELEP